MNIPDPLKKDLKHFVVNIFPTSCVFLFYLKFGFYGWPHLLSVLALQYAVLPLDDWMEKERSFPYYVLPMLVFAGYFYPLVTALVLLGDGIVNIQALLNRKNFLLERLEGLGNILVYVLPFTLPIGLHTPQLYAAAILFILFLDSFHKIGHRETAHPQLMWATGLICLAGLVWLFGTLTSTFLILAVIMIASLLPFKTLTEKAKSWRYSQLWFGLAGYIAIYYYLYFVA
jgi:hypothetical protein